MQESRVIAGEEIKESKLSEESKVSVIVPIYKVENYLVKCIDSILNQTYKNLEVILVDDGSPDSCPKICDDYCKIDDRISVFHKENGGLSDARNFGLKKASGDFIAFVDSDDYIAGDYIEHLMEMIKSHDADMSTVLPLKFRAGDEIVESSDTKVRVYGAKEALEVMLYQKEFDNAAWGKLYKREIVEGIEFPKGKLYEDIGTTYKYILNSKKVAYSNATKYYYLQRDDSIMGAPFRAQEMDYVYQSEKLLEDMLRLNDKNLIKAAICRYLNANFSILLKVRRAEGSPKEKAELKANIKKYRLGVLFDPKSRLKTKGAILLNYIGVL